MQPEKFKEAFPPKPIRCNKLFTAEADFNKIVSDDNRACMNTKSVKSYYHVTFQSETTISAVIYRENFKGLRYLEVRAKKITEDEYERFYCVVYSNLGPDTEYPPLKLPDGNSKTLTAPYIQASKAVLEREEELLHRDSTRPSMVCDELIRENDPYTSYS